MEKHSKEISNNVAHGLINQSFKSIVMIRACNTSKNLIFKSSLEDFQNFRIGLNPGGLGYHYASIVMTLQRSPSDLHNPQTGALSKVDREKLQN